MPSTPIGKTPPKPIESLEERFHRLAARWRTETEYLSSSTQLIAHPAYQEIIQMGTAAIPLILSELARCPDHWFSALKAITGASPTIDPADRGRLDKLAEAWLRWGKENGHQW